MQLSGLINTMKCPLLSPFAKSFAFVFSTAFCSVSIRLDSLRLQKDNVQPEHQGILPEVQWTQSFSIL